MIISGLGSTSFATSPSITSFTPTSSEVGTEAAFTGTNLSFTPVVTIVETLTSFNKCDTSAPSASQTFTVEGENLTSDITIAANTEFEYSLNDVAYSNSITLAATAGSVATTTIYIRLKASVTAISSTTINVNSTDADTTINLSFSGIATNTALHQS